MPGRSLGSDPSAPHGRRDHPLARVAEHEAHLVSPAIVHERDGPGIDRRAVELGDLDPAAAARGVRDRDLVARLPEAPPDLEPGPGGGDARIELERLAVPPQPEDALEPGAVHPAGGARVPSPTRAPGVLGVRADVARDDVRLAPVARDLR